MTAATLENGELVLVVKKTFSIEGYLDLRGTGITSLPDGLHVGGYLYKNF